MDHAGATLPSEEQKEAIKTELFDANFLLANPHSHHASGEYTSALVKSARNRILEFFGSNPSEYAVIFTQNTTHALKTVAECFDFGERTKSSRTISTDVHSIKPGQSHLVMLQDSHTSVAGMRGAADFDHCVVIKDISDFDKFLDNASDAWTSLPSTSSRNLLVLTPMSNFCGRKYDLSVVKRVRKMLGPSWAVCMDAAAMVGTSPFDLVEAEHPDFVTISFYKMFGYPTGLGALLVRRDRGHLLRKRYFGGGTVKFESPTTFLVDYKDDLSAKLEDGTLNYYAIAALRHGFDDIERFGGIRGIHANTQRLVSRAYEYISSATCGNGNPVARIYGVGWASYGTKEFEKRQGPILTFNLLRDDGSFVGFMEVSKMCDLFSIDVRTGCFCNQGACSLYLDLTDEMMQRNHEVCKALQRP
ncbi:Protein MOCS-1 [Aphelenchoides avenae]|nr:Protein MOCS-1 [Aphelenchus avenae]